MKTFNQKLIEEFRANGGQLSGQLASTKPMLLTTTGAKSGEPRTVVLGYRMNGDQFLAIASNNGNDIAPAWYGNLLKNPRATIEVGSERHEVLARTADPEERKQLAGRIDYLERQQVLTSREIPIVIFERA